MRSHPKHPFDPSKRVVVPVVFKEGKLTPFYGGAMPKIREGWVMDLVTEMDAFVHPADVARFQVLGEATLLKTGTTLFAAIGNRLRDASKTPPHAKLNADPPLPVETILVPFILREDLKLHLRGTLPAELMPCLCEVDVPKIEQPTSVNQAYTRLSEHYETWRRSHTGNVFDKVYFEEQGTARPLDVLRTRAEAVAEQQLFHRSGQLL